MSNIPASALGNKIKCLFEKILEQKFTETQLATIEDIICRHIIDLTPVPTEILTFFDNILQLQNLNKQIPIPPDYPYGHSGLINILFELKKYAFDFKGLEDYGEGIEWIIENLNLNIFISREGDFYELTNLGMSKNYLFRK